MKKLKLLMICIGLLCGVHNFRAQTTSPNNPVPDFVRRNEERRQEMDRINGQNSQVQTLRDIERNRRMTEKNKLVLSAEQRAEIITANEYKALDGRRDLILPAPKYFTEFKQFLLEENTGLARIYPDRKCDEGQVVDLKELERCAGAVPIRGGGSFYSFRNRTNLNQSGVSSDVHFVDGKFVVGSRTEFGLIGEIGDVRLEDLTLKSKALIFLKDYEPQNKLSKIKAENLVFEKGQAENGFVYAQSAPFKLNSVYVLRSVAYSLERAALVDNRVDIIVAFKVVAKEEDGSLILLWKELKSEDSLPLKDK